MESTAEAEPEATEAKVPERERAAGGFTVRTVTWRVYCRPGQPGGSFTGRRNAPAFTSASTPALLGKTVERWVDPPGFTCHKKLRPLPKFWNYLLKSTELLLSCVSVVVLVVQMSPHRRIHVKIVRKLFNSSHFYIFTHPSVYLSVISTSMAKMVSCNE